MSWQKCPVCNGTGKNYNGSPIASSAPLCPTCNGHRIISELTGQPPPTQVAVVASVINGGVCNSFTPSSAHSSATICKWCGKEKWLHPTYVSNLNPSVTVTSRDKCVMCGEDTIYLTNTPISYRIGYVEGAGQLCPSCYEKS